MLNRATQDQKNKADKKVLALNRAIIKIKKKKANLKKSLPPDKSSLKIIANLETIKNEPRNIYLIIVIIIIIVISAFGTITKGLLKGLEDLEVGGRVETIKTTAILRTARILRRVLET